MDGLIAALSNIRMSSSDVVSDPSQPSSVDGCRVLTKIFSQSFNNQITATCQRSFVVRGKTSGGTDSSGVSALIGNRSKTGRKASPSVSCLGVAETRQSCLPPKKRHRLHMSHIVTQSSDVGRAQGVGRGRRGRPPKLRTSQPGHKPYVKTSRFCSKSLLSCC